MSVENAKKQDYLAVGNYAAKIRQDATFHVDFLTTSDIVVHRFLTTAATRLAGIKLVSDTVVVSGFVAVAVTRIRNGTSVALSGFVLDGALITATDTVVALPAGDINDNVGVEAGDAIRIATAGTTPTAANISMVLQFAQNGPR